MEVVKFAYELISARQFDTAEKVLTEEFGEVHGNSTSVEAYRYNVACALVDLGNESGRLHLVHMGLREMERNRPTHVNPGSYFYNLGNAHAAVAKIKSVRFSPRGVRRRIKVKDLFWKAACEFGDETPATLVTNLGQSLSDSAHPAFVWLISLADPKARGVGSIRRAWSPGRIGHG
jgi:hypothetical protein